MKLIRIARRAPSATLILMLALVTQAEAETKGVLGDESRSVDVVVCLDLSGSMENLLDSTRARIWDVVNELARLKPTPRLRVGLLSYGTQNATEREGWIVRNLDLTDDLDSVYAELMGLTIGGDTEYVGQAISAAIDGMSWSRDWNSLRVIFVAGNESADQGVEHDDFRIAIRAARDKDIIVNALYAGNREQGVLEKWPEVAQAGAGNFSAIDPVAGTLQIATPQDDLLLRLNAKLNMTYLPYGERGRDGLANQVAQDSNASRLGVESCSSRIVAKGGALYTNASWDLVDKTLEEGFDWNTIPIQDLPEEFRAMTREQRMAVIGAKRSEREAIQLEIQQASAAREAFVEQALRERSAAAADGVGEAMRKAIREQALAKGFRCDGC